MSSTARGALIVLEGCDRSGKSTQCKKLVEALNKRNIKAEMMSFPDRTTPSGKLINHYLLNEKDVSSKTLHLLFSANRWELEERMTRQLRSGVTLIVDRYAFSGVAYSIIKPDMEWSWCCKSDEGLPKPDLVFLLKLNSDALIKRPGFGKERFETDSVQKSVAEIYEKLKNSSWKNVDADRSIEGIHSVLLEETLKTVEKVKHTPLEKLW